METKYLVNANKISSLQEKISIMRSRMTDGVARNLQYNQIMKSLERGIRLRMIYGGSWGVLTGNVENSADLIFNDEWAFKVRKKNKEIHE